MKLKIETGRAVTNAVDNETLARHRWYPIKEGFSANFVSESLEEMADWKDRSVLAIEPFSGSGTTPVECARLGIGCEAYEVNPFLAFVGQTKLRRGNASKLRIEAPKVLRGLRSPRKSQLESYSTFCEGDGKDKWLFNKSVLRSFAGGWAAIDASNHHFRAFHKLALMRAVMENCNASPDGKCLRYKRLESYNCFNQKSLIESFEKYISMIIEDLEAVPLGKTISSVKCADVRTLSEMTMTQKFDFCVTSPPYLNSFDYSDVYRPELFLSGIVTSNAQLMKVRLRTLRSHIQANWTPPTKESFGALYAKSMMELREKAAELWNPRIPQMVQAYFEDMENLLSALAARANPDALLKIAVSTSAYGGVVIPVDFILAEIAELCGWRLKDVLVIRRLRTSAQNWKHEVSEGGAPALRESVVVLRYPETKISRERKVKS